MCLGLSRQMTPHRETVPSNRGYCTKQQLNKAGTAGNTKLKLGGTWPHGFRIMQMMIQKVLPGNSAIWWKTTPTLELFFDINNKQTFSFRTRVLAPA